MHRLQTLLLILCLACGPAPSAPEVLRLVRVLPEPGTTLLLNEDLALNFDADLDPSSVTRISVALTGEGGRVVDGTWRVHGSGLSFSPAPVRAKDLGDGGYRPGETLELVVRGFPSPAALRSDDGHWLEATLRTTFRVIEVGASQPGFVFIDATQSRAAPLEMMPGDPGMPLGRPLAPGEPLVLRCKEPIDPSSLVEAHLEVRRGEVERVAGVRLLELVTNYDDEQVADASASRALLAVHFDRTLDEGTYRLHFVGRFGSSLTDFRGHTVAQAQLRQGLVFRVGHEGERSELSLDFEVDTLALPLAVEGADGTARWAGDGRVSVRYPAAAGSGVGGDVVLEGAPLAASDLHTTSLVLPGEVEQLLPERGLVVLRAQGRMDLAGRLVRRSGAAARPMLEPLLVARAPYPTLSEFLAQAARDQPDWTVLVAGGDLVVTGAIDIDTPLLVVAGGRVRGASALIARGAAVAQCWLLGDGGFMVGPGTPEGQRTLAAALVMDPPTVNVLRRDVVFAVASSPLDVDVSPDRWREHEAIGRGAGGSLNLTSGPDAVADPLARGAPSPLVPHGDWFVHFAPRDLGVPALVPRERLASTPWGVRERTCRIVLELRVHAARRRPDGEPVPGQPWDPPFIDRVRLAWSPR